MGGRGGGVFVIGDENDNWVEGFNYFLIISDKKGSIGQDNPVLSDVIWTDNTTKYNFFLH